MAMIETWCVAAGATVSEISNWLLSLFLGPQQRRLRPEQEEAVTDVEIMADDLVDIFRRNKDQIAKDAREAFRLIGLIPQIVRWDEGLKESLSALILAAVHQAERFGDGTGKVKRRFAIDLVVRVLERYHVNGLPFLSIERTLLEPFVCILVDWSVKVLNIDKLWPSVPRVALPRFFQGGRGALIRLALWFSAAILWLKNYLFLPTKYERELRTALADIRPEADKVVAVLPPSQLMSAIEDLVNVIVELGQVTAPYVSLVERALRLASAFSDLSDEERDEVVFRMLRGLVVEAYADDDFAMLFIDSPLGDYLLRAIVEHTKWVLARNGLLSVSDPMRAARAA
jgi:hypothetical protein